VKAKLDLINSPLSTAVTAQKDLVGTAYDEVKKLQVMMEVDMINNLGVLLTFSDNDGD
jgi:predicted lipoprotein